MFKREEMGITQNALVTKILKEAKIEVKDSESLHTMQALDSISQGRADLLRVEVTKPV